MIDNSIKEVIEMNIPGFTAEASLFNVSTRYQGTAEAGFYGGLVQPASLFSNVFYPDQPVPVLSSQLFYPNRPFFCLRTVCTDVAPPGQTPRLLCRREIGFWDPVTASCSSF
jgi:hypothetical protein